MSGKNKNKKSVKNTDNEVGQCETTDDTAQVNHADDEGCSDLLSS
jgi:hypothetical protein